MANGVVVQDAVFSVAAVAILIILFLYRKRKVEPEQPIEVQPVRPVVEKSHEVRPTLMETAVPRKAPEAARPMARTMTTLETADELAAPTKSAVTAPVSSAAPKPTTVINVQASLVPQQDGRNERILAGISENIRKSLQSRPVQDSPVPYSESKPRNTEYVRVKKEIISPHGHIRFSILKDWMSINMLAVFRRASLGWKTPDDLIAFLPAYLEPEADILNNQVLLIGTPGHREKLAVPIRSLDSSSPLRDCFDFVTDIQAATNTPAVLLQFDSNFEVVSRGVITQAGFTNTAKAAHTEVKLLADRSPEALQKSYSAALRRMEPRVVADVH